MKLTRLLFISLVINMVLFGSISLYMYRQLDDATVILPTRTTPGDDKGNGDKPVIDPIDPGVYQDKAALYEKFKIDEGEDVVFSQTEKAEIDDFVKRSNDVKRNGNFDGALAILDEGLEKYSKSDLLCTYKAGVYFDKKDWANAEIWYKKAHYYNRQSVWHVSNVANVLSSQKKHPEYIAWQQKAYDMEPTVNRLISLQWARWHINDFTDYFPSMQKILQGIDDAVKSDDKNLPVGAFQALHMPVDLPHLLEICKEEARKTEKKAQPFDKVYTFDHYDKTPGRKLKIAYLSYDIRGHAVGIGIQNVFTYHNRDEFEIYVYNSYDNPNSLSGDTIFNKIKDNIDHMIFVNGESVRTLADRIYNDQIDVLIDIALYTAGNRLDVFAVHPAPVQISGIGLATTTGSTWIDYLIVDNFVVPAESMRYYTENMMYMPHSYHHFSHNGYYPLKEPTERSKIGLPDDKILLCNHANVLRMEPNLLNAIIQILKKTENTALVLKNFNGGRKELIEYQFKLHGIYFGEPSDPKNRLYWAHNAPPMDHIAQKSACDLYMDSHWYNGHSTTGDMLWAGVPMITYPGETMAARAAGSFALSLGFPELIVNSWEEYVDRAVNLVKYPDRLKGLRKRMETARSTSALFDSKRWTKNFEKGIKEAWQQFVSGSKTHIIINDLT